MTCWHLSQGHGIDWIQFKPNKLSSPETRLSSLQFKCSNSKEILERISNLLAILATCQQFLRLAGCSFGQSVWRNGHIASWLDMCSIRLWFNWWPSTYLNSLGILAVTMRKFHLRVVSHSWLLWPCVKIEAARFLLSEWASWGAVAPFGIAPSSLIRRNNAASLASGSIQNQSGLKTTAPSQTCYLFFSILIVPFTSDATLSEFPEKQSGYGFWLATTKVSIATCPGQPIFESMIFQLPGC